MEAPNDNSVAAPKNFWLEDSVLKQHSALDRDSNDSNRPMKVINGRGNQHKQVVKPLETC